MFKRIMNGYAKTWSCGCNVMHINSYYCDNCGESVLTPEEEAINKEIEEDED